MLVITILLISVVVAAIDDTQNETAIALPIYRLPASDDYQGGPMLASDLSDYQAFQRFKYLVYPNKFAETTTLKNQGSSLVGSAFARNITIDEIQLPTTSKSNDELVNGHNMFRRRSDHEQSLMEAHPSLSLESRHYPIPDYNQHEHHHLVHPNSGPAVLLYGFSAANQPNSFPSSMQGMTHMADPLFVMATLAFVAFLINSIMGLVDRLNLLPLVPTSTKRRGKVEPVVTHNRIIWPERRHDDQSEEGVEALLRELEITIRAAFDRYEKCAKDTNACDQNPTANEKPKN